MSRRRPPGSEEDLEVREGTAGAARHLDREAMRARAETPDFLPPQALDERQAAIGTERLRGGPPLEAEVREAEAQAPDVPPTEAREPPA